jgi:hypothetical protein
VIAFGRAMLANWKLIGIAVLLGLLGLQTVRVADGKADLANERAARSAETSERNRIALRESERVTGLQLTHAAQQQEIVDVYTQIVSGLEAGRAADAVHADRVRRQFASSAARDREAARADPAACGRLADRSELIASTASEGGQLLAEARRALSQRDAEVSLLLDVVRNDRGLFTLAPVSVLRMN